MRGNHAEICIVQEQASNFVIFMFLTLNLEKLQKAHTRKVSSYNLWIEKHCKISKYMFEIRKCSTEACYVAPSVPREDLAWELDPVLDTDGESDRPSLNDGKKKRVPRTSVPAASINTYTDSACNVVPPTTKASTPLTPASKSAPESDYSQARAGKSHT